MKFKTLLSTAICSMRYLFLVLILASSMLSLRAQTPFIFAETFDQSAGVRGRCTASIPDSCRSFVRPANGQWTIAGNFSALTDSSFFQTQLDPDGGRGVLVASNLKTELCFVSRIIDISQFRSVSFSLNLEQAFGRGRTNDEIERDSIIEDVLENDDYVDVKYIVDGDTILVANYEGEGNDLHTKINDFGASTVSVNNVQGKLLQILVCVRNNAVNETIFIDNVFALATVSNPTLAPDCPLRAVLILDESGSIGGFESFVKTGAQAFVDALLASSSPGNVPQLAVIEFSTLATNVFPYTSVDAAFASNFATYIATFSPSGSTNWTAALNNANALAGGPADLIIFFTDGVPNDLSTAITAANTLKASGAHIYVVGVGSGINIPNIQSISGLVPDTPPAGTAPAFEIADYVITNFPGLQQVFSDIPREVCNTELRVTKTISGNEFCSPDTATITITVTDIAEGEGISGQNVVLTDIINAGFTFLSDNGGAATSFAGSTLTWNIGTLADGTSTQLQVMVVVNPEPANHSNTATVTAANALPASASFADASITVGCTQLQVIKSISENQFCPPDTAIFTITVNDLPDPNNLPGRNVVLTDLINGGYTYISNNRGAIFNNATNTLTWNIGTIPNGGSTQIQITAAVNPEPANHSNMATATASNAAAPASAGFADAAVIVGCTELNIKTTIFGFEYCPPDTTVCRIVVTDLADPNNLDANLAILRDTIKNGYTYISNDRGAIYDPVSRILTWNIGTIPNLSSVQINIRLSVNAEPADHAHWATASADNALDEVRDGFSGAIIAVRCCPQSPGGSIGYNQTLCGPGNKPAKIVGLSDPDWAAPGEALEYAWLYNENFSNRWSQWKPIPNANQASYEPGPLQQTTYFVRCVRSKKSPECPMVESNIVKIEVGDVSVAKINVPNSVVCNNQLLEFSTPNLNIPDSWYTWDFGPNENPRYLNGATVKVDFDDYGNKVIKLKVERNGCTATDEKTIFVTNSSQLCDKNAKLAKPGSTQGFSIYPNPVTQQVTIAFLNESFQSGSLQVLQLDGKVLLTKKIASGELTHQLDLSAYQSGVYFVKLILDDGSTFIDKVVKQ